MARQYKLRLRDGTVLAVDHAGLRTWLIDDRAMVQPMGTRGWRPLREVLAEEAVLGSRARSEVVRQPQAPLSLPDQDIPAIPVMPPTLEALATPDPRLDAPAEPSAAKRPAVTRASPAPLPLVPPPPADAPIRAAASAPAVTSAPVITPAPASPSARATPPAVAAPVSAIPTPAPPRAAPALSPATALPTVGSRAPAAPPRLPVAPSPAREKAPAPAARPPVPAPRPARVPAPAAAEPAAWPGPLIPEPPPEDAPPLIEDLPVIPLKPFDDEDVVSPRVSLRVAGPADRLEETDLADELALVIQQEVAKGHAVVIPEEELEELDLLEEDFPPARDARDLPHLAVPPPIAAAVTTGIQQVTGWLRTATAAARAHTAPTATALAGPPGAASIRPEPSPPPPSLSELPVVPFAKGDSATAATGTRRRLARAGLAAVVLLAATAGGIGAYLWIQSRATRRVVTAPTPPPPPPETTPPQLPREVVAAIEQLPHLAPDTVQILVATSPFGSPEPPDVFRRARQAVKRGIPALTPEEARELAVLERAVLVRLGPADRERVMAYDRVRGGRDLAPKEDARVLGLFARGTRSLPAEHRERLQVLSGKAIAAALSAGPAAADAGAPAR